MQEQRVEAEKAAGVKKSIPALPIRPSMRGLKRCTSCGALNGQRSTVCQNEACELRRQLLLSRRPFDPVQLVCHQDGRSLYSLRCKENYAQPRNFVQLTERLKPTIGILVPTQQTLCYSCNSAGGRCQHVLACSSTKTDLLEGENGAAVVNVQVKPTLPQAEVYTVAREVLFNLIGIDGEQKQRLWNMCQEDEQLVPAVQRINATLFVVKCTPSKVFPAGRLHVTAVSNGLSVKKGTHSCACKKLKIIVEPDNSVVMQEEVCDHILLVLAAILSKKNAKMAYGNFTNALKSYWMPADLEAPIVDSIQEDALFGLSIDIGGFGQDENDAEADNIFIYDNEFLDNDHLPDFSDVTSNSSRPSSLANAMKNPADLLLPWYGVHPFCYVPKSNEEPQQQNIETATKTAAALAETHLELSDCNIELMDEFQLTDQIDLCSDDITLLSEPVDQLFGSGINISEPTAPAQQQVTHPVDVTIANIEPISNGANTTYYSGTSLLKTNQLADTVAPVAPLPPIEMPTIAVVKKCPVKATEIIGEVKTRKFPHLPAKRALIVNSTSPQDGLASKEVTHLVDAPSLAYSAWLDYVIETINDSIEVGEQTDIVHNFHVHEEIFAHFSKSFSTGIKRRIPNSTTVIKSGKHKGLFKYTWYFPTASTVRRIFSTQNISLETERIFERNAEGSFVPYVKRCHNEYDTKHKRIYPKLALYMVHIWFDSGSNAHKTGFKLEWLPNALPKSNFGILTIEFSLGIRDPHKL